MGGTRAGEGHDGDLVADCHVRDAADLLAHRWDAPVLLALRPGPVRRRELGGLIGPLSDRSLTQALGRVTAAGLVRRVVHREAPPRVDYELTRRGVSFVDGPLAALGAWALEQSGAG